MAEPKLTDVKDLAGDDATARHTLLSDAVLLSKKLEGLGFRSVGDGDSVYWNQPP